MKKTSRTKLTQLTGPTTLTDLDEQQLSTISGGRMTKWSWSMPQDPDDIFRLDDE